MKKLFSKIFNSDTGSFIEEVVYFYEGKPLIGYVVYRGYIMFGLCGHDTLGVFLTRDEAEKFIEILKGRRLV